MARVNIMLPDDLLARIDQVAREEGMTRSKMLRTAVLAYFDLRKIQRDRQQRHDDIEHAMAIQDQLRQVVPPWDPLKALRQQRQVP